MSEETETESSTLQRSQSTPEPIFDPKNVKEATLGKSNGKFQMSLWWIIVSLKESEKLKVKFSPHFFLMECKILPLRISKIFHFHDKKLRRMHFPKLLFWALTARYLFL